MGSSRGWRALASGIGLLGLGIAASAAWRHGLWATLTGVTLVAGWVLALRWSGAVRPRPDIPASGHDAEASESLPLRALLDQIPVPLLSLRGGDLRALNRAARSLFATDDRIVPAPAALADPAAPQMRHEGRRWRIDRVDALGDAKTGTVMALIDVEAEGRAAEARATAEMIQVLGHELLNGLAPIVSLAESGLATLAAPSSRADLLPEILGTLARRAEGLLRFTEAYRTMARLPDPVRAPTPLKALCDDLAHLFTGRWAGTLALDSAIEGEAIVPIDRDQMTQGVWALLQNGAEAAIAAGGDRRVGLAMRRDAADLVIDVTDSGDGVPAVENDRIFRLFYTTKADGSGIGLSLARQVARAHGGDLMLAGTRPTRFRMRIPVGDMRRPTPAVSGR